jgi:beta-galactosidase
MMEKYNDGKKMPAVPKAPMPIITVPKFELRSLRPSWPP